MTQPIQIADEVRDAVERGIPVLALESTIFTHGLPRPRNLQVALDAEDRVRAAGVVPATIGVVDGRPTVGLSVAEIERLSVADSVVKLSLRDLPSPRQGPEWRDDGRRDGVPRTPRRSPGLLDRRPRRSPSRRSADVRRIRRPPDPRGSSARRGERGCEVDPGHPPDPRAARDAQSRCRRLSDDRLSRLLHRRFRLRHRVLGVVGVGDRRHRRRARRARHLLDAAGREPRRHRRAASGRAARRRTRASARRALQIRASRAMTRRPFLLDLHAARDGRTQSRRECRGVSRQCLPRRRDRRRSDGAADAHGHRRSDRRRRRARRLGARDRHRQSGRRHARTGWQRRQCRRGRGARSMPVRFIGRVGTDPEGDALAQALAPPASTCASSVGAARDRS